MAVIKANLSANFVVVPNSAAQDKSLSWEARGVLVFMLSMPNDWAMHRSWLQEQCESCGRDKLVRILKELEDGGYLLRTAKQTDGGRMDGWDWIVYPESNKSEGLLYSRTTENPLGGEPAPTKDIFIQNKQETKKDLKDMSVSAKHDGSVNEIFAYWQSAMNSPRSKLGADKKKKILTALKTYSVEEIKKAILGCAMTPFNMGDNDQQTKYNGLELILRNSEKIDKFISHADNPPAPRKQKPVIDNNDTSWGKDFGDIY